MLIPDPATDKSIAGSRPKGIVKTKDFDGKQYKIEY